MTIADRARGGREAVLGVLAGLMVSLASAAFGQAGNTAARANSYDDAWQADWVANAKAILAGGSGQVPGMVLWIGDSLTRDPALGAWAQRGTGKTAEDQAITAWMNASTLPQSVDSIDGFALATPYVCSARSYTVGDSLGAWDFMGACSMPADTNPVTARQKLLNCDPNAGGWSNCLNLTTILAGVQKAQFAVPEVNLLASNPADLTDFQRMLDLLISKNIVPIIITYTYRTDAKFNLLVDQYNVALRQLAQTRKLPLIDLQAEMLARIPFTSLTSWDGRFLSDGVHYTNGGGGYTSTSSPYIDGGDPATHTTGAPLTYNGYGLKGWLGVQKMKEIKALVVDAMPPPPPAPTVSLSANPASVPSGGSSTLTWSSTNATSCTASGAWSGSRAISGSQSSGALTNTSTFSLACTGSGGTASASATVTVAARPGPPTMLRIVP